jgi:hypothetical protein
MTDNSFVAIEILGGFGAGKTTLCNTLQKGMLEEGYRVYRQDDYSVWRNSLGVFPKLRLMLTSWRLAAPLLRTGMPLVFQQGSASPLTERLRRFARVVGHRVYLPLFARERKPGVILLDEWCVNQLATIRMPAGGDLPPAFANLFYKGVDYMFVYVDGQVDQLVENVMRRARSSAAGTGKAKSTVNVIFGSGDKALVQSCVDATIRFHSSAMRTLALCGNDVITYKPWETGPDTDPIFRKVAEKLDHSAS